MKNEPRPPCSSGVVRVPRRSEEYNFDDVAEMVPSCDVDDVVKLRQSVDSTVPYLPAACRGGNRRLVGLELVINEAPARVGPNTTSFVLLASGAPQSLRLPSRRACDRGTRTDHA